MAFPEDADHPPIPLTHTTGLDAASARASIIPQTSETDSVRSGRSSKSTRSGFSTRGKSPSTAATSPQQLPEANVEAQMSSLSLNNTDGASQRIRVVYVTEQISHHPPVSAYYASCPSRNVELAGIDQISAKVSGTTLRVAPGHFNKGIFVTLTGGHGEGEQYKITHPVANINGILRGSFYVTVADSTIITCSGGRPGMKYRTIIEYKEEVRNFRSLRSFSL